MLKEEAPDADALAGIPSMGIFNPTENSIHLKVVYYGPAFGGKTTNLTWVKQALDPSGERGVLSLNTDDDTTLFFDYLPLRFRLLGRYQVRVQGYTVPGQVRFNTTRRLVLKGADGVVFVADSSRGRSQDNVDSLLDLHANMADIGLDASRVPLVLQYNKQDRPGCLAAEEMDAQLNRANHPFVPAIAINGTGVFEAFHLVLRRVLERAHAEYQLARRGLPLDAALAALDEALAAARAEPRPQAGEAGAPPCSDAAPPGRDVIRVSGVARAELERECSDRMLLEGAVAASMELSSRLATLLEQRGAQAERLAGIVETGQRVVHDLRKPITSLKNVLYLLKRGAQGGAAEAALALADDVMGHMAGLLDRFAEELARREGLAHGHEVVDLAQVVDGILRRLSYFAHEQGVELRVRAELPRVVCDREEMTSVLSNLAANAIQYHDPAKSKRTVEIDGRPARGGWIIAVRDNGIGVPDADRARVFTKYGRGTNTGGVRGTGLGLYMARAILRAHGGRIGLRSAPGRGSTFWMLVPARRVETGAGPDPVTESRAARASLSP